MHFLYFLLIGLMAGWLASKVTGAGSHGLLGDLLVGVVGGILGGLLFRFLGLVAKNLVGELITATLGAVLLIYLLRRLRAK